MLPDAQERGLIVRDRVRELRGRRRRGSARQERRNGKLKVGVDIPTPVEIRAIVHAAAGRWRPFLLMAIFTGLRASSSAACGGPTSTSGRQSFTSTSARTATRPSAAQVRGRRAHRPPAPDGAGNPRVAAACPKTDLDLALVFRSGAGNVEDHPNIVERGLKPTLVSAGVTVPALDDNGVPIREMTAGPSSRPSTPACTRCATSMRRGSSTGRSTAGRVAGQGRAGAHGALLHHGHGGHLRASVPAAMTAPNSPRQSKRCLG